MATLKTGSTVGGNIILHQGMLPLYTDGDRINYKSFKVYTEYDKPTPVELNVYDKPEIDKQFARFSSEGSPNGTWFKLGKVKLEQFGDVFKFELIGGPTTNGSVRSNSHYIGVVRTGGGVSAINTVGRASIVVYNTGFDNGMTACGIIEETANEYTIYIKISAGHEKVVLTATSYSVENLNKIWTPDFVRQTSDPVLVLGNNVTRMYSTGFKPTNGDIGLGNVLNERQVKLSGDEMTGPLIAQVSSKSDAVANNDLPRLSQVNSIAKAATDKLLADVIPVTAGGTGAKNDVDARKNLGFQDMGIGLVNGIVTMSSFDWQTFVPLSGASYRVASQTMTNFPPELEYRSGTGLFIIVEGLSGNGERISYRVVPDTASDGNYKIFEVLSVGKVDARTFNVRQVWTSSDIIPVNKGGTGTNNSIGDAAVNIGALPDRGLPPSSITDINQLGANQTDKTYVGIWNLSDSAGYGLLNSPHAVASTLEVFVGGAFGCMQRWTTRHGSVYTRCPLKTWTPQSPDVWGPWVNSQAAMGPYYSGDMNSLVTPGLTAITTQATNIPISMTGVVNVISRSPTPNSDFTDTVQTYTTHSGVADNASRIFTRGSTNVGKNWTPWVEYTTSKNLATMLEPFKYAVSGSNSDITELTGITTGISLSGGKYTLGNRGISMSPTMGIRDNGANNELRIVVGAEEVTGVSAGSFYSMKGKHIECRGDLNQSDDAHSTYVRDIWVRSDIKVKSDLKSFENPSEISEKLNGYLYMQKKGTKEDGSINWVQSAGLIAQEVQAVLPELITVDDGPEKLLRLNYNGITALNTSSINEHTMRIRSLEKQVEFLLQEVENLRAK